MKKLLFLLFTICSISVVLSQESQENIIWKDAKQAPFNLVGFEWMDQDSVYRRLPVHSKWKIPKAVNNLANNTAGGQLRFITNSNKIHLDVVLTNASGMYHMPATAQSGFDIYVQKDGRQKYLKTANFSASDIHYKTTIDAGNSNKKQQFTINFPLYNGVESVRIGIEKNATLEKPNPFKRTGKIVIYGTSITQGGCVSRPGMVYSNILSRKLDVEFVNLGFSGNGKGEPELAHIISEISGVSMLLLDYEANASATIQNTIEDFVTILRAKFPKTPIVIMSKIRYAYNVEGSDSYRQLISNRNFQKELVYSRKNKGDTNIYFLDGSTVLGDDYDECTVDGVHPTDLGSYRIANALLQKIQGILK